MDIDFIITWVDNQDPAWQEEKARFSPESKADSRDRRYRSWDNLQYIFRGIEKFAPWYHKIYLVTCGHYPAWLNKENDRLVLVKHEDYIPKEWLPTFSSRTIDMNFHRIESLTEHFVYFNDDMFLTGPVREEDFFKNGLPRDAGIMKVWPNFNLRFGEPLRFTPVIDTFTVNEHISKKKAILSHPTKWFNFRYGRWNLFNLALLPWNRFTGFHDYHLPVPYLKKTYREVWEAEPERLADTCSHRFREGTDLNIFLFRYWRLAKGEFAPQSPRIGYKFPLTEEAIGRITDAIRTQKYAMVCTNDMAADDKFEMIKAELNSALDAILPEKSSFEL